MSSLIAPCAIVFIVTYGVISGVDIYQSFAEGVKKGLGVLKTILAPMLLMTVAIQMVTASGALELVTLVFTPVARVLGLPVECVPLALLRPFSSAGALSIGINVMEMYGVASYPGRVAAVMLGSAETSFYTIGIYSAQTKIKRYGVVVAAAVIGDMAAFMCSALFVRLLM